MVVGTAVVAGRQHVVCVVAEQEGEVDQEAERPEPHEGQQDEGHCCK